MKLTTTSSSPSQTAITLGALLLIIGLVVCYLFLVPQLKQANTALAKANADLASAQGNLTNITTASTHVAALKQKLAARNIDLNQISQVLPATEDIPSLYIQIQDIMDTAKGDLGVTNGTYQIADPVKTTAGDIQIPISVTATGSYTNLKTFIARFEDNIRPITFTSINFAVSSTPSDSGPSTDKVTLTATGFARSQGLSSAYTTTP